MRTQRVTPLALSWLVAVSTSLAALAGCGKAPPTPTSEPVTISFAHPADGRGRVRDRCPGQLTLSKMRTFP
jgi:hypothetical protein